MVLEGGQMVEEVGKRLLSERMLLEWQQRSVAGAIGRPLSIFSWNKNVVVVVVVVTQGRGRIIPNFSSHD
jgi:hypothetical protein